jgi:hypothetical protein
MDTETQYLGVFYCDEDRPTYNQRFEAVQALAPETTLDAIFESLKRQIPPPRVHCTHAAGPHKHL